MLDMYIYISMYKPYHFKKKNNQHFNKTVSTITFISTFTKQKAVYMYKCLQSINNL